MTAIHDRDAARWIRLLVAMGEETDEEGHIMRPEFAVKLVCMCWHPPPANKLRPADTVKRLLAARLEASA